MKNATVKNVTVTRPGRPQGAKWWVIMFLVCVLVAAPAYAAALIANTVDLIRQCAATRR